MSLDRLGDGLVGFLKTDQIADGTDGTKERPRGVFLSGTRQSGGSPGALCVEGRERSDQQKRHACLVPDAELPESEKEYDRKSALETLKGIIALGYSIREANEEPK